MASISVSMYEMMWKSYKLFETNVLPDPFQLWSNGRNSWNEIRLCIYVCVRGCISENPTVHQSTIARV